MTLDRDNLEGAELEVMEQDELHACLDLIRAYQNLTIKTNGLYYAPVLSENEIKLKFAAIRKKGIEAWQTAS